MSGAGRKYLGRPEREERIAMILGALVGDDKTTREVSKVVPLDNTVIKNTLCNLKGLG
jgi:hypothetical protein